MPRAFLLKNYYPRNHMEDLQTAAANLLDLASSAPAPNNNFNNTNTKEILAGNNKIVNEVLRYNDLLKWDYEYEKSYWFDTSALIMGGNTNHPQQHNTALHNDSLGAAASSSSSIASCSPPRLHATSFSGSSCDNSPKEGSDLIIPRLTSRDFSTKSFMHTTIKAESDTEDNIISRNNEQLNSDFNNDKTQTGPPTLPLPLTPRVLAVMGNGTENTEQTLLEFNRRSPPKLSAHHNQMTIDAGIVNTRNVVEETTTTTTTSNDQLSVLFDKTMESTERTMRQFFDNNRVNVGDLSRDTGLDKSDLQNFMDGITDLPVDEKMELYKWYLGKIQKLTIKDEATSMTDESFACHKCGKIFTYKSYLERHIKYVCPDSTGRTWKCTYCGKAFQYPCYLRRHIRSHTGESPYKCDKCDRAFVRSTDLQRHIRNHTGEKPYQCSQCSRAFARSTDLKRHMRTHTGEKPYKCWQCGKSFSQSGSLQTHVQTHNKELSLGKGKKKVCA